MMKKVRTPFLLSAFFCLAYNLSGCGIGTLRSSDGDDPNIGPSLEVHAKESLAAVNSIAAERDSSAQITVTWATEQAPDYFVLALAASPTTPSCATPTRTVAGSATS